MSSVDGQVEVLHPDRVLFRPLDGSDRELLARLFERLSLRSRYLRYFSPMTRLPDSTLEHLAAVDHDEHEAIGAFSGAELIGAAHYFRSRTDPRSAEISLEVADDHQGHGLGSQLFVELARRARANGITEFTATALGENKAVLSMVYHSTRRPIVTVAGPELEMTFPLVSRSSVAEAARLAS